MYNLSTHPHRHKRGMIVGEFDLDIADISQSLPDHVGVLNAEGNFRTEYCNGTEIVARQALTASFDQLTGTVGDTVTLTGLPNPCMLFVNTQPIEVSGGVLEFIIENIGESVVEVKEATYEIKRWIITGI